MNFLANVFAPNDGRDQLALGTSFANVQAGRDRRRAAQVAAQSPDPVPDTVSPPSVPGRSLLDQLANAGQNFLQGIPERIVSGASRLAADRLPGGEAQLRSDRDRVREAQAAVEGRVIDARNGIQALNARIARASRAGDLGSVRQLRERKSALLDEIRQGREGLSRSRGVLGDISDTLLESQRTQDRIARRESEPDPDTFVPDRRFNIRTLRGRNEGVVTGVRRGSGTPPEGIDRFGNPIQERTAMEDALALADRVFGTPTFTGPNAGADLNRHNALKSQFALNFVDQQGGGLSSPQASVLNNLSSQGALNSQQVSQAAGLNLPVSGIQNVLLPEVERLRSGFKDTDDFHKNGASIAARFSGLPQGQLDALVRITRIERGDQAADDLAAGLRGDPKPERPGFFDNLLQGLANTPPGGV